jgi:hypothetical protein
MELAQAVYKEKNVSFLKSDLPSPIIQCFIEGVSTKRGMEIMNSVVSSKNADLLYAWKVKIADCINNIKTMPVSTKAAAISITFFFYRPLHGNKDLDIENFVKPVIDGIAKGLFSKNWPQEKQQEGKVHFNEDDSIFKKIYLEYHDHIEELKEGLYITVWPLE